MKYFLLISTIVTLSCSSTVSSVNENSEITAQNKVTAQDISVEKYKSLISDDVIILDVRRKIEFEAGHLKNAINIDWFDGNFMAEVAKLDKTKPLLIHCASGGRSSSAMKKLNGSGFNTMYNMLGGFNVWKRAGYDFEK